MNIWINWGYLPQCECEALNIHYISVIYWLNFTDRFCFLMKYETIFWWVYQPYVFLRGLVLMTGFQCHCGKAARGLLSTERKYLWELHVDTNLIGTCFFCAFHWIFTNRSFRSRKTSNHGLKVFRAFLKIDLLYRDLHANERAYKK